VYSGGVWKPSLPLEEGKGGYVHISLTIPPLEMFQFKLLTVLGDSGKISFPPHMSGQATRLAWTS